jgi:hypothetical protein
MPCSRRRGQRSAVAAREREPPGGFTPGPVTEVSAVVLGNRGGTRLARALASVAWAGERVVLDPADRLVGERLPAGVCRHRGARPGEAGHAPWLLLLDEHEVAPPALASAVAEAVRAPTPWPAYRVPVEVTAFGARLRPRSEPVRLARRSGVRLALGRGLTPELSSAGAPGRLSVALEGRGAESLGEAVEELDAYAGMMAALLAAAGAHTGIAACLRAFVAAGSRMLWARGAAPRPWSRWSLAVLAGYRAMVAHAKLWEVRFTRGAEAP